MSKDLKPCPMCGSEPKVFYDVDGCRFVRCQCGIKMRVDNDLSIWNRRRKVKLRFVKPKKLEFVPCEEHGQEAKPLTVEQLYKIADTAFALKYEQTKGINLALFDAVVAIHTALPPDQSARIAEMESERDRWMKANGENTVSLHHCFTEINQLKAHCDSLIVALKTIIEMDKDYHSDIAGFARNTIDNIKAGQS